MELENKNILLKYVNIQVNALSNLSNKLSFYLIVIVWGSIKIINSILLQWRYHDISTINSFSASTIKEVIWVVLIYLFLKKYGTNLKKIFSYYCIIYIIPSILITLISLAPMSLLYLLTILPGIWFLMMLVGYIIMNNKVSFWKGVCFVISPFIVISIADAIIRHFV